MLFLFYDLIIVNANFYSLLLNSTSELSHQQLGSIIGNTLPDY